MAQQATYNGYDYAFSVVMAVYNVAPYLDEAVGSLERQTIGFDKIQVILVDDGSTDTSPAICDAWQKKYPNNVVVIHKKNGGVSSARNEGLKHVRGQYVNFLDPDDKLSMNAMQEVYTFFAKHEGETDIVAIPMHYFDAMEKPHIQNFKFNKGTRVIDLLQEWEIPHASASSSFIVAEKAVSLVFDTRVTYGEDACYVNKMMLHKATIGMVSKATYYYRKRSSGDSAMQNTRSRKAWYLPSVHYFMEELLRYAWEIRGEVPLFTQYNVMYDMQWRITQEEVEEGILTPEELEEYRDTVYRVLAQIDDKVILSQKFLLSLYKYYALRCNHKDDPVSMRYNTALLLNYGDAVVAATSNLTVAYSSITVEKDEVTLMGYLSVPARAFGKLALSMSIGKKEYPCKLTTCKTERACLGDPVSQSYSFVCTLPLKPDSFCQIVPGMSFDGEKAAVNQIRFDFCAPMINKLFHSYALLGNYCLIRIGNALVFKRRRLLYGVYKELALARELLGAGHKKALVLRPVYKTLRRVSRMNHWLIDGGSDPADPGLRQLIDSLQAENPSVRLHVLFDTASALPDKVGSASVVKMQPESMKYKLFWSTCKRVYFHPANWNRINPHQLPESPYRDVLSGMDFMLLNGQWQVQESYLCDSPRHSLPEALQHGWHGVMLRLTNNGLARRLTALQQKILRKLPQNYVLFESVPPYTDNSWAVYQYIRDHQLLKGYKLMWVLNEGETAREDIPSIVKSSEPKAARRYERIAMRTKAFVFCNRTQRKVRKDQLTINLGHGSCLKSVHGYYTMPKDLDYTLIQAPAFEGPTRYEHNFADSTIISALGYPRNDDFFGEAPVDRSTLFDRPFNKLLVWYPTYRQHKNGRSSGSAITLPLIHDAAAAERINACAAENGVLIVLKPHFAQDTSYIRKAELSNLVFIDDSFFTEHGLRPYQFLHMSDGLITDFSSVYYDYLLQDKPIALVWEDLEEYRQVSGFSVDIDEYCAGGEKIYTEEEFCDFIRRIAREQDVLREPRARVCRLTNAHVDGHASKRTAQWIEKILQAYPSKVEM